MDSCIKFGSDWFFKAIRHQRNQIEHVYDVNDFIHGKCYNFTVVACTVDRDNASSSPVIFQTSECVLIV